MLNMHHEQTLWVYSLVIILGFWVLLFPQKKVMRNRQEYISVLIVL